LCPSLFLLLILFHILSEYKQHSQSQICNLLPREAPWHSGENVNLEVVCWVQDPILPATHQPYHFPSLGLSLFIWNLRSHDANDSQGPFQLWRLLNSYLWEEVFNLYVAYAIQSLEKLPTMPFCCSPPFRLIPTEGESFPAAGSLIQPPCGEFCYAYFTVGHVKSTCIS
jgi:hypothetical protein